MHFLVVACSSPKFSFIGVPLSGFLCCFLMGYPISCSLFETFSSFLEWVVCDVSGIVLVIHYLDSLSLYRSGSSV